MEGRRVSRRNQKYNPLFILFLCLVAAVIILLILSIVLGARLKSSNKKLTAAEAKVTDLTESVSQLQEQLLTLQNSAPAPDESSTTPPDTQDAPGGSAVSASWLDLSGHSEVSVPPTNLLDAYATYYTTAGVNLRSGPATSYDRIKTVDYGTKVDVAAREGNWSFVRAGNQFGWINSDYLSTTEPPAQTASTGSGTRPEATSGSIRP